MTEDEIGADSEDMEFNLYDLEKGLGARLPKEAFDAATVGQVYDIVWPHLQTYAEAGGQCPSAASYYLLKREIQSRWSGLRLTPETSLAGIPGFVYLDLQAKLRRKGWSSPPCFPRTTASMTAGYLLLPVVGMFGGAALMDAHSVLGIPLLIASPLAGPWLAHRYLFRRRLPAGCATLGDLAVSVMRLNLRRLRGRGATGLSRKIVWRLVTQGVGRNTEVAERDAILV